MLKFSGPLKLEASRNSWLICQECSSDKSSATSRLLQPSWGSQKFPNGLAEYGLEQLDAALTMVPSSQRNWPVGAISVPKPTGSYSKMPGTVLNRLKSSVDDRKS